MPKMVTIEVDPSFAAPKAAEEKAAWEAAKAKGPMQVPEVTAAEAVKYSRGMYRIRPEGRAPLPSAPSLQELPLEELKRLYVSLGGKVTDKLLKRSEIITFISNKLDAIEVVDDEIQSDGDGE